MSDVWIVRGATCLRYPVELDRAEGGVLGVGDIWAGLAEVGFGSGWDAAVHYGDGKAYFFSGDGYVRLDIATRRVETELRSIGAFWTGMADAGFADNLDAAVNAGDGNVYFFRGDWFVVYSIAADAVVGTAGLVADWRLAADGSFDSDLDAVVNYGNGKLYAFKGDQYTRYDVAAGGADGGPSSIAAFWPGLGDAGMADGLRGSWCDAPPGAVASTPAAAERPPAVETPGGGRITDKRDPAPADLVTIAGAFGQVTLHRLAADWWARLVAAARADGIAAPLLGAVSGYRSTAAQKTAWEAALVKYGSEAEARKWVAPPGNSAHHSGRAVDCWMGSGTDSENVASQRATPQFTWLTANAARFGFYPYEAEPWHWEYNPPQ